MVDSLQLCIDQLKKGIVMKTSAARVSTRYRTALSRLTLASAGLVSTALTTGCDQWDPEELAFRKTMEYNLVEACGDDDQACVDAVKSQLKGCMEKSDWKGFVNDSDNEAEKQRFVSEFYSCVVDEDGNPYFVFSEE